MISKRLSGVASIREVSALGFLKENKKDKSKRNLLTARFSKTELSFSMNFSKFEFPSIQCFNSRL
jgi:hypothetical protein